MNNENLKSRTKQFALRIIKLVESLPSDQVGRVLGNQLLRAGTSVGANYRAACRSKSAADFISKMGTVEEEADESGYRMELLVDSGKNQGGKNFAADARSRRTHCNCRFLNQYRENIEEPPIVFHSALRIPHSSHDGVFDKLQ